MGYIGCTGAVSIGGLYDTNFELSAKTSVAGEITNEEGREGGYSITVEEAEAGILVEIVVDQAISIAVKRAASFERRGLGGGWWTLTCLDEVCSTLGKISDDPELTYRHNVPDDLIVPV